MRCSVDAYGKSGAGKSSLCNALFQGEVTPVSDVHAGPREVQRFRLNGRKRTARAVLTGMCYSAGS
ncbi:50S ribosome-binding GTPase, partial [Escherichia coli]|nr:50S ribosome-binding GTPase [Escherichia coli]